MVVKGEVSCVSWEERPVVGGQVTVGSLVVEVGDFRETPLSVSVDRACPCAP